MRTGHVLRLVATSAAAAGLAVLTASPSHAHGYTTAPTSRAEFCAQGAVGDCGEIQYEPQSVEAPKGFPAAGPSDGHICAGDHADFAQLDDPRGGTGWPVNHVTGGQSYTFRWHLTAQHRTTKWEYFVTSDSYDPAEPLTRDMLEPQPFLTIDGGDAVPPADVSQTGTVPGGKSGRQLILAVWTIADTGNAFYQCSDVDFG